MRRKSSNQRQRQFAWRLLGDSVDHNYRTSAGRPHPPESALDPAVHSFRGSRMGRLPADVQAVRSTCFSCNTACESLIFVDKHSGKVLKVQGDPESPVTGGILCPKGLAAADLVNNRARLLYPMKRIGRRGEGEWQRISWDEALDFAATKILSNRDRYGTQGVAFLEGTRRGWSRVFSRLANAFGAVNHGAAGWAQCLWPRLVECKVTFGAPYTETADFSNTNCVLAWGNNPPATWPVQAAEIMEARQRGAALIVVDPNLSETAAKADIWLQLRPGTDTALALALLHVIITRKLFNRVFVNRWTIGFEELKQHVVRFTPQWGEKITRVPSEVIIRTAELYARANPACISRCVSLDQLHDSVQACRAVSLLAAVSGNVGIPGGNILTSSRGDLRQNTHEFIGTRFIDASVVQLRRGYDRFPLLCGELCPVPSAHMPTLWETMATGHPYPIKAVVIFGSNALVSYSNSSRVMDALNQLDFLLVTDLFMTPTAEMADLLLPASSWLERDNIISSFQTSPTYTIAQCQAAAVGEARSDIDIICDLAHRLGVGEHFWRDEKELFDFLLGPAGLSFRTLAQKKRIYAPLQYRQYEKRGFNTPSGKVELFSSTLKKLGLSPVPDYIDPFESPISEPALTEEYPFILTTGARVPFFRHSENRQNPLLNEQCPNARVFIHPAAAGRLGIEDGDWVIIETRTGWAKSRALLSEGINPDVVQAIPGWGGEENINRVIPWDNYAEGIGTVPMRGLLCRLHKDEKNEPVLPAIAAKAQDRDE
jgi:anaerobic selenocysteine-containing dehydrogenase